MDHPCGLIDFTSTGLSLLGLPAGAAQCEPLTLDPAPAAVETEHLQAGAMGLRSI
ncbi:MAG: hypothetical protein AAGD12_04965 [Pseudomonadota bacterium]